jgi:hypothetical protein
MPGNQRPSLGVRVIAEFFYCLPHTLCEVRIH